MRVLLVQEFAAISRAFAKVVRPQHVNSSMPILRMPLLLPDRAAAPWSPILLTFLLAIASGLSPVEPVDDCQSVAGFFDPLVQRCRSCEEVDENARLVTAGTGPGPDLPCRCEPGFVQCLAGERCVAENEFTAMRSLECRKCPIGTTPSEKRKRCVKCPPNGDGEPTTASCTCPPGHAFVERNENGTDLIELRCMLCATNTLAAPEADPVSEAELLSRDDLSEDMGKDQSLKAELLSRDDLSEDMGKDQSLKD